MIQLRLLYSVLIYKDIETLALLKDIFFSKDNVDVLNFMRNYLATVGSFPSPELVEDEFKIEFERLPDKPSFFLSKVISKYRELLIEDAIKEAVKSKKIDSFRKAIEMHDKADAVSVMSYLSDYSKAVMDAYEERRGSDGITYLSTGWKELDSGLYGIAEADYWVLGGAEGSGKTFWLLRLANNIRRTLLDSKAKGRPQLFVNNEMTTLELIERVVCIDAEISYRRLNLGSLKSAEYEKLVSYTKRMEGRKKRGQENLAIISDINSVEELERYIRLYNPAIIYVDGIHLLSKSFDWKDLMETSVKLKALTRRYMIPVISVVHLKAKEGISEKTATIDSFAYFKAARDADIAGVLFQDELLLSEDKFGIKWVKGRKGQKLTVYYQNDREKTSSEISGSTEE